MDKMNRAERIQTVHEVIDVAAAMMVVCDAMDCSPSVMASAAFSLAMSIFVSVCARGDTTVHGEMRRCAMMLNALADAKPSDVHALADSLGDLEDKH